MKYWFARLIEGTNGSIIADNYGRWVPTGQTTRVDAVDYIKTVYPGVTVREWLQL